MSLTLPESPKTDSHVTAHMLLIPSALYRLHNFLHVLQNQPVGYSQSAAIYISNLTSMDCYSGEMGLKVSKGAKIRNRYNQVPHLTQDTNGKVTNSQLDTTNESQEVSPFPASDHKAHINRRSQRHSKHKTEQKHKRSTKEVKPWNGQ